MWPSQKLLFSLHFYQINLYTTVYRFVNYEKQRVKTVLVVIITCTNPIIPKLHKTTRNFTVLWSHRSKSNFLQRLYSLQYASTPYKRVILLYFTLLHFSLLYLSQYQKSSLSHVPRLWYLLLFGREIFLICYFIFLEVKLLFIKNKNFFFKMLNQVGFGIQSPSQFTSILLIDWCLALPNSLIAIVKLFSHSLPKYDNCFPPQNL